MARRAVRAAVADRDRGRGRRRGAVVRGETARRDRVRPLGIPLNFDERG